MASVLYDVKNHVASIILNRPDSFNSFDRDMALGLQDALDNAAKDDHVRAIYLTGNGKAFSAGQDLKYILDPHVDVGLDRIVPEHFNPIVKKIYEVPKPVICGVNGVAAGAGANIALMCDITLATESARFIQAFSGIGLVPDSGGTYALPRLVGFQKGIALALLGDTVLAPEAERMGMIYKWFPDSEFAKRAFEIVQKVAIMPTKALGLTKQLFNMSLTNSFEEQLELEAKYQVIAALSDDYKEGVQAFVEKRQPNFNGK